MEALTTLEIIMIIFIIWMTFGSHYYCKKILEKKIVDIESNLAKALSILLGGPAVWIFHLIIKPFLKKNRE